MTKHVVISGGNIRKHIICERLPYMDQYANRSLAIDPLRSLVPALENDTGTLSPRAEESELDSQVTEAPQAPTADRVEVAPARLGGADLIEWTLSRMRAGVPTIVGGVLRHGMWFGRPESLIQRPGESNLGPFLYEPAGTRASTKASLQSIAIPLTFYALLLERVQGARPTSITVESLITGSVEMRPVQKYVDVTLDAIARLERTLSNRADPGPRLTSECDRCQWQDACRAEARDQRLVTLLPGVRPKTIDQLGTLGIRTLDDIIAANPLKLGRVPAFRTAESVVRLQAQAQAHVTGTSVIVGRPVVPAATHVEAFLDFEADAVTGEALLTGLLVRRGRRFEYLPFLADSRRDVPKKCRAFLRTVSDLPESTPVFHYGPFEKFVLKHFPMRVPALTRLEQSMFDVLPIVRHHACIPSRSFGLKEMARALGIKLPDTGLDGRAAPMWWEAWSETRQVRYRTRLLTYNKADLRALVAVLDWLRTGPRWRSPGIPSRAHADELF